MNAKKLGSIFTHPYFGIGLLFICVLAEALFSTRFLIPRNPITVANSTLPYFFASLGIAIIPLISFKAKSLDIPGPQWLAYVFLFLIGGFTFWMGLELVQATNYITANFPIDFHQADMLPVLQTQAQRFIDGEAIYEIIPEIWGGIQPIYLPGFWLPYVPFKFFEIDIRWGTTLALIGTILLVVAIRPGFKKHRHPLIILPFIPLFFLMESIWTEQTYIIRFTEEGLSILFYALLGFGIWRKNPWIEGLAIGLCMISRYALLPWIPIYGLFVLIYRSRADAFKMAGVAAAIFLFVFLLPYGIKYWDVFFLHPGQYQDYANRLWTNDLAFFQNTLGLAKYFSIEWVPFQHRLHIISVFLSPAILFGIYIWRRKKAGYHSVFWGLCSLKIALVMFFNLIVVPVYYLFFVNSIFSAIILAAFVSHYLQNNSTLRPST